MVASEDSGQLWLAGRAGESPRMVTPAPGLQAGPAWYPATSVAAQWQAPRALPAAGPEGPVRGETATTVAPFLQTPYYGNVTVTSIFDHNLPNYSRNGVVVRYDGVSSGGTGWIGNLTMWYDGHDGIDFGTRYVPILASADGTVTVARWASASHTSSYGLHVEIDHGNGFRTRYGHMSAAGGVTGPAGQAGAGNRHQRYHR